MFRKETIILKDSNRTITNNHELAETFNTFFSNITQNLKVDSNLESITENLNISGPVLKAIKKYEKYPSIIKIEKIKNKNMSFSFSFVTKETMLNDTVWNVSKYGVFSGPYFPVFGLKTERYEVPLRIQSKCGKIRTRKNCVLGHFSRSVSCTNWIPKKLVRKVTFQSK